MNTKDDDKKQDEQQDKGFAVHDKRRIGKEGADEPWSPAPDSEIPPAGKTGETPTETVDGAPKQERPGPDAGARGPERGYIPLTFTSFVMSLSTSALIYLGQVPDPASGNTVTDLTGARQTIDLISLLKEKTKGNLTPDEESFIETVLYDLRMLFVKLNK